MYNNERRIVGSMYLGTVRYFKWNDGAVCGKSHDIIACVVPFERLIIYIMRRGVLLVDLLKSEYIMRITRRRNAR